MKPGSTEAGESLGFLQAREGSWSWHMHTRMHMYAHMCVHVPPCGLHSLLPGHIHNMQMDPHTDVETWPRHACIDSP